MADTRGMYELGRSLNSAADTFGNLPEYDVKQAGFATQLAAQQNALAKQNDISNDAEAENEWQQQAADRDDFGTADYANDKVKFMQAAGASPAAITKAQMDAAQATQTGQSQDLAESYVQNAVEDRVAQHLGLEYYKNNLQDLQTQMTKAGTPPDEAFTKMRAAAIQAGKQYMQDQGIVVNIDHSTGNIAAIDKDGNQVPIDPDIAAQAYKMIGHPVPWNAMKDIQNESLTTSKALGTGTNPYGAPPLAAAGGATPAVSMAVARTMIPQLQKEIDATMATYTKAAVAALATGDNATHDSILAQGQAIVAPLRAQMLQLQHNAMGIKTPQGVAPVTPGAPSAAPVSPSAAGALMAGSAAPMGPPQPTPAAAAPAPQAVPPAAPAAPAVSDDQWGMAAAHPQPQSQAQVVAAAQQLVENLHLDRQNLNSPEFQQYLATLDPQMQAALSELMQHIAAVKGMNAAPRAMVPPSVAMH